MCGTATWSPEGMTPLGPGVGAQHAHVGALGLTLVAPVSKRPYSVPGCGRAHTSLAARCLAASVSALSGRWVHTARAACALHVQRSHALLHSNVVSSTSTSSSFLYRHACQVSLDCHHTPRAGPVRLRQGAGEHVRPVGPLHGSGTAHWYLLAERSLAARPHVVHLSAGTWATVFRAGDGCKKLGYQHSSRHTPQHHPQSRPSPLSTPCTGQLPAALQHAAVPIHSRCDDPRRKAPRPPRLGFVLFACRHWCSRTDALHTVSRVLRACPSAPP